MKIKKKNHPAMSITILDMYWEITCNNLLDYALCVHEHYIYYVGNSHNGKAVYKIGWILVHTQAQKIVVWKLSVSLQNLRWNFIFILLRLLLSKNFGCCCLTFLRGRSWLVKRFTPCGQLTNQLHPLKTAKQQHKFCKDGDDER